MKLINTIVAVTLSHCEFLKSRLTILFWEKNNHGSWAKKVRIKLNTFPGIELHSPLLPSLKKMLV